MNQEMTFDSQIESYLAGKDPQLRQIVSATRQLVESAVPRATKTLNSWRVPSYEFNGPLFYLDVSTRHVTLGFFHGAALADPRGFLEGTGKNLRHVKVTSLDDLQRSGLKTLLRSAAALNRREAASNRRAGSRASAGRSPSPSRRATDR